MTDKKRLIHIIVIGILLVIGTLFIVLASRGLSSDNGTGVGGKDFAFIIIGTVSMVAGMINILILAIKILKEKSII